MLGSPASPFVADFVGADRLVKLLAVTPVDAHLLTPAGARVVELPTVPRGATLRTALGVLLGTPAGRAVVVGDDGTPLGELTVDAVHAHLRAAPHEGTPVTVQRKDSAPQNPRGIACGFSGASQHRSTGLGVPSWKGHRAAADQPPWVVR